MRCGWLRQIPGCLWQDFWWDLQCDSNFLVVLPVELPVSLGDFGSGYGGDRGSLRDGQSLEVRIYYNSDSVSSEIYTVFFFRNARFLFCISPPSVSELVGEWLARLMALWQGFRLK